MVAKVLGEKTHLLGRMKSYGISMTNYEVSYQRYYVIIMWYVCHLFGSSRHRIM